MKRKFRDKWACKKERFMAKREIHKTARSIRESAAACLFKDIIPFHSMPLRYTCTPIKPKFGGGIRVGVVVVEDCGSIYHSHFAVETASINELRRVGLVVG